MNRRTTEEEVAWQLRDEEWQKMSGEELIELFMPHGFWEKIDFFLFWHLAFLWCIMHWKWYDDRTDSYSLREYLKTLLKGGRKWI